MRPAALVLLLAAALVPAPLGAQTVTLSVDGIERQIPVVERQGRRFVALETVARLLGGRIVESGPERAVLEVDDSRLVVRRRLPYVEHDGRWYQIVDPAQKDAAGFYLPASALENLLPILWPGRFPPAPTSSSAGTGAARLPRIDVWAGGDRTRLSFRLASTPGVAVDDGRTGVLALELSGATLPAGIVEGLRGVGLVDSASVRPTAGGALLTLWLAREAGGYAVAPLRGPAGLEVLLRAGPSDEATFLLAAEVGAGRRAPFGHRELPAVGPVPADRPPDRAAEGAVLAAMEGGGEIVAADDRPAPDPVAVALGSGSRAAPPAAGPDPGRQARAAEEPSPEPAAPPRPAVRSGWKVVLDAGHGGRDPGSIGRGGTREKDVTLAVTLALADRLRDEGIEVYLTRESDEFVALGDRTRLANRTGADLFVSIHANSAANRAAGGFETYFLSAAKTEDARRVARMENAALRYESDALDPESLDELNFILWDLAQNEYLRESGALAETIQVELDRRLSLESRGVKQAGFYVLNGAFMPAILFEMAFISNPREERLLDDRQFRTRLVDGLADGVLAFLDQYSRKVLARKAAR